MPRRWVATAIGMCRSAAPEPQQCSRPSASDRVRAALDFFLAWLPAGPSHSLCPSRGVYVARRHFSNCFYARSSPSFSRVRPRPLPTTGPAFLRIPRQGTDPARRTQAPPLVRRSGGQGTAAGWPGFHLGPCRTPSAKTAECAAHVALRALARRRVWAAGLSHSALLV